VDLTALQAAADAAQTLPYSGRKAVVVGAGPGGSTAAMVLARQGFSVDVSSLEHCLILAARAQTRFVLQIAFKI